MPTAAPTPSSAPPGTDVCCLTITTPQGTADLALPRSTALSTLIPALLHHTRTPATETPWTLQRLGEDPLDPDGTPETLNLHHGDILHLRPADSPLPALHFDDIADGVAHVVSNGPGRWRPQTTQQLALTLAAGSLLALAAGVLGAGPGALTAACAGAAAVLLAAGCAVVTRTTGRDQGAVVVTGVGALGFAALAGLALRAGAHGGYAPGAPGVLTAAAYVTVVAATLLALRALPAPIPGTALLTAVSAAACTALIRAAHWDAAQAVATVAVALFVLGHFGPRLALRTARLRVPALPHNAEELQQDIEPEPLERVEQRVNLANACLDTLNLGSGLLYTAAFWYLARTHGWISWALPLVLAGAVLLRARGLARTLQRVPTVLAGATGLALLLLVRAAHGGAADRTAVLAVLLLSTAALLLAARRLPTARLLPIWGHAGDLLETASTVLLLPLLLQALHTYAYLRSLAG
ncbi:type VII secretion integral membrane protein EccD [Streptacidiphilus sp. PB12-B1b]|uniref:type VII secretion integral membrane protein EccD n=1 Tax=Streptacidiphilus sp. PB12-B1b TaxID=2705012 RepID=UPI0015FE004C|nr:type VII secretion integral membrane protein EccD [Streptacidiphilus sp. PB12-B1b]QMU77126.1 type VII secretion integral membrane protein EccD [Streptacidiphilus sp. PB12-B1b]